jgi:hypothetical protein
MRNDLAKEILSDYPRHREFVGQFAREYFISKRTMENQVAYAERSKNLSLSDDEIRARDRQLSMKRTDTELAKEGRGTEVGDFRQKTDAIIRDISTDFYMNSKKPVTKSAENAQLPAFFEKLEAAKGDPIKKPVYDGSTVADRMVLDKRIDGYERNYANHVEKFGYAPHVTKSIMLAYCGEKGIYNSIHSGTAAQEYASMLVQQKLDATGLKEPTFEMTESAVRQALCFKALQNASGTTKPTINEAAQLHVKASILAEHLTKENLHVLNNDKLMKEAAQTVSDKGNDTQSLGIKNTFRLLDVNRSDNIMITQAREAQKAIESEKSYGGEISL